MALIAVLLRVGATVLLAACAAILTAQHGFLLDQKNRTEVPVDYEPLTFREFLAMPALPAEYAAPDWDLVQSHSRRAVSLEGYIAEVRRNWDGGNYGRPPEEGDLHVHLRDTRQPQCLPEGPRGGQLVAEITPHFQPPKTGWSFEALWDLCVRQVRVRVSGWLLHDFQHLDGIGRWRASGWEVHPVTRIEVWDAERQGWAPLP